MFFFSQLQLDSVTWCVRVRVRASVCDYTLIVRERESEGDGERVHMYCVSYVPAAGERTH